MIIENVMADTSTGIIGTGKMATGLGTCFACGGLPLCIGSREPGKAQQFADGLKKLAAERGVDSSSLSIVGGSVESVLQQCRVIVLAIPARITNEKGEVIDGVIDFLAHHGDLICGQNKILVDITYYGRGNFGIPTPPEPFLSAIEYHASQFDDSAFLEKCGSTQWVCGFKSVGWTSMRDGKKQGIEIAGDEEAKEVLGVMISKTGFKPLDCGSVTDAGKAEPGSPQRKPHPEASV